MKISTKNYLIICGIESLPEKYQLKGKWAEPATERQKVYIDKCGVCHAAIRYKGQADVIIKNLISRQERGLATPRQLAAMIDHGTSPRRLMNVTEQYASRVIRSY